MNFAIKKEKLLNILQIADKAISPIIPYPSLEGILITIKNDYISFITSDFHISIKSVIKDKNDFNIKEEGEILLEEKMINDIVKKIDSDYIYFESLDGDLITVYGGNSRYKLNTMPNEKYPEIDFGSINKKFKVNSCILKTIVDKTAYACSEKEIQLNLTGINLFSDNGKLHALATDRFKLASKEFDIKFDEDFNIVIPKKYLSSALQCVNQEEIEIEIQNNKFFMYVGETVIRIELIEDLFPNISSVFNNTISSTLIINKNSLLKMIDRCSLIKNDKNKTSINLKIENNMLYLHSDNNISEANEEMDVVSFDGENVSIYYDSKYLLDSLKVIDTENVKIEFTKEKKAAIIKNVDDNSLILFVSPQKG